MEWIAGQRTIFRLENDRIVFDCNECGKRCGTTHKLLDYESIAMVVEKDAG